MKNNFKKKKLRKYKTVNNKMIFIIAGVFAFVSIGFSLLSTNINLTGNVTVKKKKWDATEVSYTNSSNTSVTNSKQAIEDLYSILIVYYAFGTPTTSSSTDYMSVINSSGSNAIVRLTGSTLSACIYYNGALRCVEQKGSYDANESQFTTTTFPGASCGSFSGIISYCGDSTFTCSAYKDATHDYVSCHDFDSNHYCEVYSDGSVSCS